MKKNSFIMVICFLLAFLPTNIFSQEMISLSQMGNDKWYSNCVFYELFVRSFKDSNGDRYGDFKGVTSKLDYLKDLGIGAIWLMPIHNSDEHTNNYDPVDLMAVDPTYGTMEDFQELLDEAHKRGIKIILDLVLNHTSSKHPFFVDACSNKKSQYRDWYIFSDEQPEGAWSKYWQKCETGWYYAYFAASKPDMNFRNPKVLDYYKQVVKFWLDKGVDGFRYDAVTMLVENGDGNFKHQPESFAVFRELRAFMDENYPDRNVFTVAEAEPDYVQYLGNGNDTFHAVFNFKYNNTIIRTVKNGKPYTNKGTSMIETIAKGYAKDLKDKIGGFYGTLLSSHDSYGGNRPFQQLDGNVGKTKLVGAIYLTLPGIPFVYYGEEIGMNTYTRSKYDRWLRTCMTWEGNEVKNNGFGNADKLWNHLNAGNAEENDKFNVAAEEKDPDSILNQYKAVIKARNENSALRFGDFLTLKTNNEFVAAYLRKNADSEVVVIHNFADKPVNVAVTLAGNSEVSKDVQDLLGSSVKIKASKKDLKLTKMAAYQSVIIKIK
ncbi:MAG: hypothetical protein II196_07865 [Spirochaetales bacterium]|nr:hypothetical protein [Spirochaetales bacterium]